MYLTVTNIRGSRLRGGTNVTKVGRRTVTREENENTYGTTLTGLQAGVRDLTIKVKVCNFHKSWYKMQEMLVLHRKL